MGLFWDLLQHTQIRDQQTRSETLELRVERLERELTVTRQHLHSLVQLLERHFGTDIDGDGRIG